MKMLMMLRRSFTFVVLLLALNSQAETEVGQCPDVVPFADLEVVPYLGTWYENQRIFMVYEGRQDCNTAIYSDLGDGVVEVHNTGRNANGSYTDIYGTATVVAPGTLSVEFPGHASASYIVLGTDYENYSSVYTCEQEGPLRSIFGWVLGRTYPLDDAIVSQALSHFVDNGIDISLFSPTYQGDDCPYFTP